MASGWIGVAFALHRRRLAHPVTGRRRLRRHTFRIIARTLALLWFTGAAGAANRNACFDYADGKAPCTSLEECRYELTGRQFALVVGVNAYSGDSMSPLNNAVQDARDMSETLNGSLGYEVRCVLNPRLDELTAELKLAETALRKLTTISGSAGNARFLFYFAGHGYEQSKDASGFIAGRDAKLGKAGELSGFRSVSDIVTDLSVAGLASEGANNVHPIVLIDACRVPPPEQAQSIAPTAASSISQYYLGFSVAPHQTARDGKNRFLKFLLPELVERGRPFHDIFRDAAFESVEETGAAAEQGPWSSLPQSTIITSKMFRPIDQYCDKSFHAGWGLVDDLRAVHRNSARSLRRILAGGPVVSEGADACTWDTARRWANIAGAQCQEGLNKRFSSLRIQSQCPEEFRVMSMAPEDVAKGRLASQLAFAPTPLPMSGARLPQLTVPQLRLKSGWPDAIVASEGAPLRREPDTLAPRLTPLPKGQRLAVDCESLVCTQDWVGVQFEPKRGAEPWRGFVPAESLVPARASRTLAIAFVAETATIMPKSKEDLSALVAETKSLRTPRWRVTSSFPANAEAAQEIEARSVALARIRSVDTELVAAGAYTRQSADRARRFDFAKTEKSVERPVLVELFVD